MRREASKQRGRGFADASDYAAQVMVDLKDVVRQVPGRNRAHARPHVNAVTAHLAAGGPAQGPSKPRGAKATSARPRSVRSHRRLRVMSPASTAARLGWAARLDAGGTHALADQEVDLPDAHRRRDVGNAAFGHHAAQGVRLAPACGSRVGRVTRGSGEDPQASEASTLA